LLRDLTSVTTLVVDFAVLCFAVAAYRRTKVSAFGFLIFGSVVGLALTIGLRYHTTHPTTPENTLTFWQIYSVGYVIATGLWGAGVIALTLHFQTLFRNAGSLDTEEAEEPALDPINEDLVEVYETNNPAQAPVIAGLLRSAGIEFMTANEGIEGLFAAGQIGGHNPVVGPVQFLVRAGDAAAARALLEPDRTEPPN
jgi:hypothetical protein